MSFFMFIASTLLFSAGVSFVYFNPTPVNVFCTVLMGAYTFVSALILAKDCD